MVNIKYIHIYNYLMSRVKNTSKSQISNPSSRRYSSSSSLHISNEDFMHDFNFYNKNLPPDSNNLQTGNSYRFLKNQIFNLYYPRPNQPEIIVDFRKKIYKNMIESDLIIFLNELQYYIIYIYNLKDYRFKFQSLKNCLHLYRLVYIHYLDKLNNKNSQQINIKNASGINKKKTKKLKKKNKKKKSKRKIKRKKVN